MSDRVHTELGVSKPMQGSSLHVRPHLSVGPVPETAENALTAVAPTSAAQKTSVQDVPPNDKALLDMIGTVGGEADQLVKNAERRKAVDAILARLFNARDTARSSATSTSALAATAVEAEEEIKSLEESFPGFSMGDAGGSPEEPKNAADRVALEDRARVIAKIEAALKRVEKLRSEIAVSDDHSYSRLLNMSSAVSGLNVARNRVAESLESLSSAANTADNVMVNLRAVVLGAHGKVSPDIVRLVLP